MMKRCYLCKQEKPKSEFHKNRSKPDGLELHCKICRLESNRKYRKQNKRNIDDRRLRRDYGISMDDYDRISASQGHRCAICGSQNSSGNGSRFCVDHDHVTGRVRALLCGKCNKVLGLMHDNPDLLENAAEYVRTFQGTE